MGSWGVCGWVVFLAVVYGPSWVVLLNMGGWFARCEIVGFARLGFCGFYVFCLPGVFWVLVVICSMSLDFGSKFGVTMVGLGVWFGVLMEF